MVDMNKYKNNIHHPKFKKLPAQEFEAFLLDPNATTFVVFFVIFFLFLPSTKTTLHYTVIVVLLHHKL